MVLLGSICANVVQNVLITAISNRVDEDMCKLHSCFSFSASTLSKMFKKLPFQTGLTKTHVNYTVVFLLTSCLIQSSTHKGFTTQFF